MSLCSFSTFSPYSVTRLKFYQFRSNSQYFQPNQHFGEHREQNKIKTVRELNERERKGVEREIYMHVLRTGLCGRSRALICTDLARQQATQHLQANRSAIIGVYLPRETYSVCKHQLRYTPPKTIESYLKTFYNRGKSAFGAFFFSANGGRGKGFFFSPCPVLRKRKRLIAGYECFEYPSNSTKKCNLAPRVACVFPAYVALVFFVGRLLLVHRLSLISILILHSFCYCMFSYQVRQIRNFF